ncbi:uncharacterized protein Eint_100755 [Encephalitozoon intestinalis ATCC 50506]|uniref:Uncharacterized protein n=1 Tax=Encephalitozoon intestinalis (strain ATCC 50506) TaxID=876142 RepID=W8Q219_ENCIT|nr:uncharacterized protein Eint_100755 [Encephalitozoon intestinalis ATCC 50506]AHL30159.1 hypothetical protein Eint_100755 [Encephalitozoon intestinalis ATCC 50506]UTX46234.1 hypothetical protein GPK93_10g18320 [Encephalitozoon intestinalis]
MMFKDKMEMISSLLGLILTASLAPRYFYGSQVLIVIITYSTALSLVKPMAKKGKLYFRIINALHVIAKIMNLLAFFIIMNNVFVMRMGYKNCRECFTMTTPDIVVSILFFIYYSVYSTAFVFFFGVSAK